MGGGVKCLQKCYFPYCYNVTIRAFKKNDTSTKGHDQMHSDCWGMEAKPLRKLCPLHLLQTRQNFCHAVYDYSGLRKVLIAVLVLETDAFNACGI